MLLKHARMCWTTQDSSPRLPNEEMQGKHHVYSLGSQVCCMCRFSQSIEQELRQTNQDITGIPIPNPTAEGVEYHTVVQLNSHQLQTTCSLNQRSLQENSLPRPLINSHSDLYTNIQPTSQQEFTRQNKRTSQILSLNCAKNMATTTMILQTLAKNPDVTITCLQEPGLDAHGSAPTHPQFQVFTPSPKPKCATYVRIRSDITVSLYFSSSQCFLSTTITARGNEPFTIYNIYSLGNDQAFTELIPTLQLPKSCILIGDFNCHHPW
jgi:hypothetical protein